MTDRTTPGLRTLAASMLPAGEARWRTGSVCLLAFLLPLAPALLPVLTLLVLLLHLLDRNAWMHPPLLRADVFSPALWCVLLFLLHLIGMAWTSNTGFGWFDIGIKLSLFLFPVLALFPGVRTPERSAVASAFCLGALSAVLLFLLIAIVHAHGAGGQGVLEFISSRFTATMHPSYFAWYLVVAIAIFFMGGIMHQWPRDLAIVFVVLACAGVVLTQSRMGWIALPIVLVWSLVVRWRHAFTRRLLIVLLALSVIGGVCLTAFSVNVRERMIELFTAAGNTNASSEGSAALRTVVWKAAWDVGCREFPLGTGTGDVKDELLKQYASAGATYALERRLNAHNQFLQTFAALGLLGTLALGLMIILPGTRLFSKARPLGALRASFLVLLLLNFSVESMLEVQAGALFTAFMLWVLWWPEVPSSQQA